MDVFESKIHDLGLNATLIDTNLHQEELITNETERDQCRTLWWVLMINFAFFLLEMAAGWLSNSMGLVADSLDMPADSLVYVLSIGAVGAIISRKKKIVRLSGYFQMFLAGLGLREVIRRFAGLKKHRFSKP